jgi:toxin ParE1/3/4
LSTSSPYEIRLARAARRDLIAILKWSFTEFGEAAAFRYADLIEQALSDIADDPRRPGSKERPEIRKGCRTYHLELSRRRVVGGRVKEPRHFVVYRLRDLHAIEILRILHDSRDLARHLPVDHVHEDAPPD